MPGPPPSKSRRRANVPARGDWAPAPAPGWQGPVPKPPDGLLKRSRDTWATWFGAWWAANWTPAMLPQIEVTIKLFDAVERGESRAVTELRQWMEGIGVTPIGQQRLRWLPPKADEPVKPAADVDPYGHLRVVKAG